MNGFDGRSSTLMAALAVSPFLFASPSSTAAETDGNLSASYRGWNAYVRSSDRRDEDDDSIFLPIAVTTAPSELSNDLAVSTLAPRFIRLVNEADRQNKNEYSVTIILAPDGLATSEQSGSAAENSRRALPEFLRIEAELSGYTDLDEDWDDAGAEPPSAKTIEIARSVLSFSSALGSVPKRSYVSPSGEVGLVWSNASGYADLSFLEDGTISYYVRSADGTQEEYSESRLPLSELNPEIWSLLRTL